MKFTPFILFLILLFVLVISIIFSRFLPLMNSKEGFVSFNKDTGSLNYVSLPQYSAGSSVTNSSVVKMYDNLFFDVKNANVIEVNGSVYVDGTTGSSSSTGGSSSSTGGDISSSSSGGDITGVSITGIFVVKRDSSKNSYSTNLDGGIVTPLNTEESKISEIRSSYNSWVYNTTTPTTDKYQLFYCHRDQYQLNRIGFLMK